MARANFVESHKDDYNFFNHNAFAVFMAEREESKWLRKENERLRKQLEAIKKDIYTSYFAPPLDAPPKTDSDFAEIGRYIGKIIDVYGVKKSAK